MSNAARPGHSVRQAEFIVEDVAALDGVDLGFAVPARAAHFADHTRGVLGHGLGQLFGQIEIASDTFVVAAIHAEDGPGVVEVGDILDLLSMHVLMKSQILLHVLPEGVQAVDDGQ